MVISRLLDANRQLIGDPSDISGTIYVLLDVQPNEETVADIALTLNGETVTPLCRGTAGDAASAIPGLAETGASVEVECQLKTSAAMTNECVGLQIDPKYANGDYELSAYVETTRGDKREAFAGQQIALNNSGYVMVAHSPGGMSEVGEHTNGLTFYGGPVAEGNVNQFHACPVAYDGTIVGKMRLSSKTTDTSQNDVAGPSLSFRETRFGSDTPSKEAPFTWTAGTDWWSPNLGLENMAGETETWVINDGLITDPDGRDVTATFRSGGMAMTGPLHFDFKAPARANTSQVVVTTSNNPAHASWTPATDPMYYRDGSGGSVRRFRITEMSDMGVGHVYGMTSAIAVGDCGVGANADTRGATAFVPLDEDAANVTLISQLPEEDPVADGVADGGGYDCFVAEVQSLADRLGNAVGLGNVPRIRTATTFGVDRTPPVISRKRPSEPIVLSSNMLHFEVEEPRLGTGEDGSQLAGTVTAWAGSSSINSSRVYWGRGGSVTFPVSDNGSAEIDITPADGSFFAREQSHTVYAWTADRAGNGASTTFTFIRDQTDPALSLSAVPNNFGATTAASISVAVAGTLSDATEIRRAFLSVHKGDTCDMDSDPLPATQAAGPVRRLDNGSNTIEFSEVFTIKQGGDLGPTDYCFYLHAEDDARDADDRAAVNDYSDQVATFSVGWPGTPPTAPTPGPTFEFTTVAGAAIAGALEVTEGDATGVQYAVSLTAGDTAMVTLTTSPGVVVAPTTLSFPNTNVTGADTLLVTVTTRHDLDILTDMGTVSHSATGYAAASVAVESQDDDFEIMVSPSSIREDDGPTAVVVTVNAGEAADVSAAIVVGLAEGPDTGTANTDLETASAGEASVTVSATTRTGVDTVMVDAADDSTRGEENESIVLTMTTPTSTVGGEGVYAEPTNIMIMDDDPDVTLSLSQSEVDEDAGTVTVTITATADAPVDGITTFGLALTGTATGGGTDYADPDGASLALTINRGSTTGTTSVTLTITDDGDDESNETIIFDDADGALVGTKRYTVGPATLTIMDNDDT